MNPPPTPIALKPEFMAMMAKGVSLILSSCDLQLTPSVMRAVASRIDEGGRRITAYVGRAQAQQLLSDIASTGRLAAVFSQPSTHLTVQFKSRQARIREATQADLPELARCTLSLEDELESLGYPRVFARAMLACPLDDLVAVEFEPDEAFDQTPGARAGQRLVPS